MNKSRIPWGFVMGQGDCLVANTSQAEIRRRALTGETAIRLLGALGIRVAQIEEMVDIDDPVELLKKLQEQRT